MQFLFEIISITGFIQGILVGSLATFHEKFKRREFTILGILILLMSMDCLCQSSFIVTKYFIIYWVNNGNLLLFGPLFYFFVKSVTQEKLIFSYRVLLHLAPFIVIKMGTLILGPTGLGEELLSVQFYDFLNQSITVHGSTYAIISVFIISRYKGQINISSKRFMYWLAIIFTLGWFSSFLGRQFEFYDESTAIVMWNVAYIAMLIMIFAVTVRLMLYSGNIQSQERLSKKSLIKYERSSLSKEESERLAEKLNSIIRKKKLYLDPGLNRTKLSEHLHVSPHILSQILNNQIKKNFSEYINEFRLEMVKEKLIDPTYKEYTILAIAFDCGFKSKSSFQRLFKKYTGYTPSKYAEAIKTAPDFLK